MGCWDKKDLRNSIKHLLQMLDNAGYAPGNTVWTFKDNKPFAIKLSKVEIQLGNWGHIHDPEFEVKFLGSDGVVYTEADIDVRLFMDKVEAHKYAVEKNTDTVIKDAKYTSVWGSGQSITTNCKVNLETEEVFGIETADVEGLENLEREYVTIDGVEYSVAGKGECAQFWYQ